MKIRRKIARLVHARLFGSVVALAVPWQTANGAVDAKKGSTQQELKEPTYSYKDVDVQPEFRGEVAFPRDRDYYTYPVVAIVAVIIDSRGKVIHAELVSSSERDFGIDAIGEARKWKMTPARKAGEAVGCAALVWLQMSVEQRARYDEIRRSIRLISPTETRK
jgi:outer membrane biosynthesis protein TonB